MSDVPSDLLREILLRVPAESLFQLRRVCKQWLRIIDDSSFIKHHTHKQQNSHTLLVKNYRDQGSLYSFSLDSLNFIKGPQMIDAIHVTQSVIPLEGTLFRWCFCNGLILIDNIDNTKSKDWVIWNPLTKECREVEIPQLCGASKLCRYAFGYDYDADDYKVVKIDKLVFPGKVVWQTHVYSLKSDSWRKIEDCPDGISYCLEKGTFFNGTSYWPSSSRHTIIALDLGTGSFSQLPLPLVDRSDFDIFDIFRLDELDGCLICSLNYAKRKTFYGWVMEDNGVDKSWIKLFSLQYSSLSKSSFLGLLMLVAFLKRKQQVVLQFDEGFLWFDIGTNSIKKLFIHGLQGINSSKICPGNLVRLNGATGLEDAKGRRISTRKRKRKGMTERTDIRMKICVRDAGEMCCLDNYSCCRLEDE